MRRKPKALTVLFIITLSLTACGENQTDAEQLEIQIQTETTTIESESLTEPTEEVRNKMFGLDDITASEDESNNNESESSTIRTDYPDSRSDHRASWDTYKGYYDDFSVYGTDTAGKSMNDLPYCGDTGYDPKGTILQYRTTDKGYTVFYDTNTGKVYYTGMTLPTGDSWDENESAAVLTTYALSKGYNGFYDVTYAEMQEVLGVYNGD